ncbi:MAG: hypothetical protein Q9227_007322 [Pyrenula ochraceoflavens]
MTRPKSRGKRVISRSRKQESYGNHSFSPRSATVKSADGSIVFMSVPKNPRRNSQFGFSGHSKDQLPANAQDDSVDRPALSTMETAADVSQKNGRLSSNQSSHHSSVQSHDSRSEQSLPASLQHSRRKKEADLVTDDLSTHVYTGAEEETSFQNGRSPDASPNPEPLVEQPESASHSQEIINETKQQLQLEGDHERTERDRTRKERIGKLQQSGYLRQLRNLDWKWLCQVDVVPGYCATPWTQEFDPRVCTIIISVALEALFGFVDKDNFLFRRPHRWEKALRWLCSGRHTWPPYARNARRGVIAGEHYITAQFPGFQSPLGKVQLRYSHEYQSQPDYTSGMNAELSRQVEIMMLDSWLSLCGKTPEIEFGPLSLLERMPSLIQILLEEFEIDFRAVGRSANDGGLQLIQEISMNLMDFLHDDKLTEAEQIFTLVALLRTAKMGISVSLGPNTISIAAQNAFATDMRVWLV